LINSKLGEEHQEYHHDRCDLCGAERELDEVELLLLDVDEARLGLFCPGRLLAPVVELGYADAAFLILLSSFSPSFFRSLVGLLVFSCLLYALSLFFFVCCC
jgi:hypothetical protein